ncbi:hypothetical protein GPECTOR_136g641 [Gonium pectorale]|uniref:SAC3/GANP/THP3 conserved domain-containing protein n=1 Tax=Gonium pectorale TaxID=33097 RepID=A0A150FY88_GONPE|nr:hypothetical protein GPECTOR_136g641 [Gonium pectorale]|eukprot:KXZ42558.1 hypothetical protein GPECTOR_136g641 [Gonium pectorale]
MFGTSGFGAPASQQGGGGGGFGSGFGSGAPASGFGAGGTARVATLFGVSVAGAGQAAPDARPTGFGARGAAAGPGAGGLAVGFGAGAAQTQPQQGRGGGRSGGIGGGAAARRLGVPVNPGGSAFGAGAAGGQPFEAGPVGGGGRGRGQQQAALAEGRLSRFPGAGRGGRGGSGGTGGADVGMVDGSGDGGRGSRGGGRFGRAGPGRTWVRGQQQQAQRQDGAGGMAAMDADMYGYGEGDEVLEEAEAEQAGPEAAPEPVGVLGRLSRPAAAGGASKPAEAGRGAGAAGGYGGGTAGGGIARQAVPNFAAPAAAGFGQAATAAADAVDDEMARRNRRANRFGPQSAAAADGVGGSSGAARASPGGAVSTPPRRGARSPVQFRPGGMDAAEDDGDVYGRSVSPSPPPSPPQFYDGGGDMMGDDEDGAGDGPALVGTCELMCPRDERKRREETGELNVFERLDPQNPKLTSDQLIIKKARKNYDVEDKKPHNLRTFRALEMAMARLRSLIEAPDEAGLAAHIGRSLEQTQLDVHGFLWDRYREVRKEVISQHLHLRPELLPKIISWNEEIARFLAISGHELGGRPNFQEQLNQEQLKKTLTDLVTRLYSTAARAGLQTPNSPEIKCYLLLLLLGGTIEKNNRRFKQTDVAQMYLRQCSKEELESPWMTVLFALLATINAGNPVAFFEIMSRAPYVLACLAASHVLPMRTQAMHMMAAAMGGPHPGQPNGRPDPAAELPLSALARMLKMSEGNADNYVHTCKGLVKPGAAAGQREVCFPSRQLGITKRLKAKQQAWITSKRSPVARNRDTVQPAQLSPELVAYCRQLLGGPRGALLGPLSVAQLRTTPRPWAGGVGADDASPRSPALQVAGAAQPSSPLSPTPWEILPEDGGPGGASPAAGPVSQTSPPSIGSFGSPRGGPSATAGPGGAMGFGSPTRGFGGPAPGGKPPPAAAVPFGGFGAAAAPAPQPLSFSFANPAAPPAEAAAAQPPVQTLQWQQQQPMPVAAGAAFGSAQMQAPHPPAGASALVDAGQLAAAQAAVHAERVARESLQHAADAALRQAIEQQRFAESQAHFNAAAAAAAHAELAEARRLAAAAAEQVAELRLEQQCYPLTALISPPAVADADAAFSGDVQGKAIAEFWQSRRTRACLAVWRRATREAARRDQVLRQQLAAATVTFVGRRPLDLMGRLRAGVAEGIPAAGAGAAHGSRHPQNRKRRYEAAPPLAVAPGTADLAGSASGAAPRQPLTPPIEVAAAVVPALYRALSGQARPGFANAGAGWPGEAGAAQSPVRQVFWKLVLMSGKLEEEATCISPHQLEAAAWLRDSLSGGFDASPRPVRQSAAGELLTVQAARGSDGGGSTWGFTMAVQDVSAERLAAHAAAAGGFGSPMGAACDAAGGGGAPGGSGVASTLAACSGVLLLVDGREFAAALTAGASLQQAAAEAGQDLASSWERLRTVLSYLPSLQQLRPQEAPPVCVLTLAEGDAADAVRTHLQATASQSWPPALAATVGTGGQMHVASLAGNPHAALQEALAYMAERAPLHEQVVPVDLERLAVEAVGEVVTEMDTQGPGGATQAATVAAFNQLVGAFEAAVRATATSPSARWGLPAPEISPSDEEAAPACWAPHRVRDALEALRTLRLPPPAPPLAGLPGGSAMLPALNGHVATWAATLAVRRQAMLLASLRPAPGGLRRFASLSAAPANAGLPGPAPPAPGLLALGTPELGFKASWAAPSPGAAAASGRRPSLAFVGYGYLKWFKKEWVTLRYWRGKASRPKTQSGGFGVAEYAAKAGVGSGGLADGSASAPPGCTRTGPQAPSTGRTTGANKED